MNCLKVNHSQFILLIFLASQLFVKLHSYLGWLLLLFTFSIYLYNFKLKFNIKLFLFFSLLILFAFISHERNGIDSFTLCSFILFTFFISNKSFLNYVYLNRLLLTYTIFCLLGSFFSTANPGYNTFLNLIGFDISRFHSIFIDGPNQMGMICLIGIINSNIIKNYIKRYITLSFFLFILLLCDSRSCLLGLFVYIISIYLNINKFILFTILLIGVYSFYILLSKFGISRDVNVSVLSHREQIWFIALNWYSSQSLYQSIIGHGVNSHLISDLYYELNPIFGDRVGDITPTLHNSFLQIIFDLGVYGFFMILFALFALNNSSHFILPLIIASLFDNFLYFQQPFVMYLFILIILSKYNLKITSFK